MLLNRIFMLGDFTVYELSTTGWLDSLLNCLLVVSNVAELSQALDIPYAGWFYSIAELSTGWLDSGWTPYLYIYKAEKLSVCLHSIHLSQLSHKPFHVSKHFLCLAKHSLSGYFKFVIVIWCGIQLLLCSRLKENNWRKLEQHSTEKHRKIAELLERVTSKNEVVGSNPGSETFFSKLHTFCIHVFSNVSFASLLLSITSTLRDGTWVKLNAHRLGTQICSQQINICFCLFFTARWRHCLERRQGTAVVNSKSRR